MKKTWMWLGVGLLACVAVSLYSCGSTSSSSSSSSGKMNTKALILIALGGQTDPVVLSDATLQEAIAALDDAGQLGASALIPGPICTKGNDNLACTTGTITWGPSGDTCDVAINNCVMSGITMDGDIVMSLPAKNIVHVVSTMTLPAAVTTESWIYIFDDKSTAQIDTTLVADQYQVLGANSCSVVLNWKLAPTSCFCVDPSTSCGSATFVDTCATCP